MIARFLKLLVVIPVIPGSPVRASVPDGLGYQGYLTDPSDQAVDADTSITFSVYAVDTGGSPLWFETLLVPVDSGLFSVTLGSPANPFPPGLFETSGSHKPASLTNCVTFSWRSTTRWASARK